MADNTLSRLGQDRGANSTTALFLKLFGGEVLTAFKRFVVFRDRMMIRQISQGVSAQFPVLGRSGSARIHTPGTEIVGSVIKAAERVISIEGLLIADATVAQIDELMNHYDVRAEYTNQLGEDLAQDFDKNAARILLKTSRINGSSNVNPNEATAASIVKNVDVPGAVSGGSLVSGKGVETNGDDLITALFLIAQKMDEQYVPEQDRTAFLRPAQHLLLGRTTTAINQFYGASGDIATGKVPQIANLNLVKTNNMPSTDESADATVRTPYQADNSNTVAIVAHKSAAGAVIRKDVETEVTWDPRRQSTLMIGKMACGMGSLRPRAVWELSKATS